MSDGETDLSHDPPAWWDARYLRGDTPWDTGIVPPEVVSLVNSGALELGWVLDLGCGSGVTSRRLAQHGFRVVGIDLAHSALARAARATLDHRTVFCQGDVTDLSFLAVQATLAVDIGCFHAVARERRLAYIDSLADHLLPGASYLLYAFELSPVTQEAQAGVGPDDLALFVPRFVLRWSQHGRDRERLAAWYLWQRTAG